MRLQIDARAPSSWPSGPESEAGVRYDMDLTGIQATLIDVAADGQSLAQAAKDTHRLGDALHGGFGSAEDVAAAFADFWSGWGDVGPLSNTPHKHVTCASWHVNVSKSC